MKFVSAISRLMRTPGILLLAVLFPLIQFPSVRTSAPIVDSDPNLFKLSIFQSQDRICVGDAVKVAIKWSPNTDLEKGLSPLAPLSGPSRIKLQGNLGRFYPDNYPHPVSVSGTDEVIYIAEKEGRETIFAQAWVGGSSDAIARDTFIVKKCNYFYKLNAEMNLYVSDPEFGSFSIRYTIKSKEALKASDPDKPFNLEGTGVVYLNAVVTSWSNKCSLFTSEPGKGMGFVNVKAYPHESGIGMVLELAPPDDFHWDTAYSFSCDGYGHTSAGIYAITTTDPWLKAYYPDGLGQNSVKIDMFEIPIEKMRGQPGTSVSYTATLTLEKSLPK